MAGCVTRRVVAGFGLDLLQNDRAGFFLAQRRDPFQLQALPPVELLGLVLKLLDLAFAALHLPLAPLEALQLAIEVLFFALKSFLLLDQRRARIAQLRFGFIAQLQRLILGS